MSEIAPLPIWIAEERRNIAKDAIKRAFDSSLEIIRWVLTSVTVFHSSALIAGFNTPKFVAIMLAGPAWAFLVGIALALGSGLALAIGAADFAGNMTNSLWRGEGLDTETNEIYDPEPTKMIYLGASLLGLSIASFLLGVGFAAWEISLGDIPPRAEVSSITHRL